MITAQHISRVLTALPRAMRRILEAEIAAGNYVIEVTDTRDARKGSLSIRLAKPLKSYRQAELPNVVFTDQATPPQRAECKVEAMTFIITGSHWDTSTEPDMNAIRASLDALERAANADRFHPGGGW